MNTKLPQTLTQYFHIDNGGVGFTLEDDNGITFKMSGQYYGLPCIEASMNIEHYTEQFLDNLEEFIRKARVELNAIDWVKRYESR